MPTFRATVVALLLAIVVAGCGASTESGASTPTTTATPTTAPTPTPTGEPIAEATDAPDDEATEEPDPTDAPETTPEPDPTATPKPAKVSYAKLSNRAWAKLVKSPDKYLGKTYQIWACITQFDAATGDDSFRGEASNKKRTYWYSDGDNTMFTGNADQLADFVEDDVVVMNVMSLGSLSYDTQAGGNTTVPLFEVVKITHKGSCA